LEGSFTRKISYNKDVLDLHRADCQRNCVISTSRRKTPLFCKSESELDSITAQKVGDAAQQNDPLALDIFRITGTQLGAGLAILIDKLNPELIIIGSIYGRQQQIFEPIVSGRTCRRLCQLIRCFVSIGLKIRIE
jgi:predicted NBD/HSP70 family sugar kinase